MVKSERNDFTGSNDVMSYYAEGRKNKIKPDPVEEKIQVINGKFQEKMRRIEQKSMEVEKKLNKRQHEARAKISLLEKKRQLKSEADRIRITQREINRMRTAKARKYAGSAKKVGKEIWNLAKAVDKEIERRRKPVRTSSKRKKGTRKKRSSKGKTKKRSSKGYVIINGKAYPRG